MNSNVTRPQSTNEHRTRASTPAADAVRQVRERGPAVTIDVRTPFEVSAESIAGTRHMPLEAIGDRLDEIRTMDGDILLLCRSGKRAEMARQVLARAGIPNLTVVDGGILAYAAADGTTEKGRQRLSLERQVRIAAGLIVFVGAVLGFAVHPGFHAIPAVVGAGLVFAGITDYCGMGLLLAKMPWNRA